MNFPEDKIPVGISSCLLGERVRYDGRHKRNASILNNLGQCFDLQGFCPELAAGMGVPRAAIRLQRRGARLQAVTVDGREGDVSDDLQRCAEHKEAWLDNLCGYIFKSASPSCGVRKVKIYRPSSESYSEDGMGLYAKAVTTRFPALPVADEAELEDSRSRDHFVQRVSLLFRWKQVLAEGLSKRALATFHNQLENNLGKPLASHYRELANLLGSDEDSAGAADEYIMQVMTHCKSVLQSGD